MKKHREKKTIRYSAEQIFDLVTDVEKYPEFIPWCENLHITKRWEEDGVEYMEAAMTISFKIHRETVHTRVTMKRDPLEVVVDYLDGPFKHLHNVWKFEDRPPRGSGSPGGSEQGVGSIIDFYIEFEIRSRVLQAAMNVVFGEAVRRMVSAFDARAHQVYGRG